MPELVISSFAKGWLDDATLDRDKIYSFKRFVNADISYERGAARRRYGYKRAHSANLPAVPKQQYDFVDTSGQMRRLVISNNKLYLVESTENNEIKNYSITDSYPLGKPLSFATYDHYPFITVGNRVFFADDNDWFWGDYSSIKKGAGPYTYECYQVGINKPTFEAQGEGFGTTPRETTNTSFTELNNSTAQELATTFIVTTYTFYLDAVRLNLAIEGFSSRLGRARVRIETVSGGLPTGTLVNGSAISNWINASDLTATPSFTAAYISGTVFSFETKFALAPGTYAIRLQTDAAYKDNFLSGTRRLMWRLNGAGSGGSSYDGATWSVLAVGYNYKIGGGITLNGHYKYTFANYNNAYAIESKLSDAVEVIITGDCAAVKGLTASDDEQATHKRIYRAKLNGSWSEYRLVGELLDATTNFWDGCSDGNVGAIVQSSDHQRLQNASKTLLKPRYLEHWHNRLFAVPANSKTLYFSKQLEERGSLGVAGDMIYDYYPAENYWTLDSEIRAVKVLEDRLIVYTSNNNVHVFDGGFSPLNPPPDLAKQEIIIGENCYDARTLWEIQGRHLFVTQNKFLKAFNGSVQLEDIGEGIEDSLRLTGSKYCATVYKNQYVLGVDTDGDSVIESLYILDLSHPLPTFRAYQYLDRNNSVLKIHDLHTTRDAVLYACPSDIQSVAYRVIQLDSGYSDDWTSNESDGIDITKTAQTHFLMPARRAKWTRFSMKGYYPSTIPTITITATDKTGNTSSNGLSPSSSNDVRGHTMGIRLASEECSITITSRGDRLDEIREISLEWRF